MTDHRFLALASSATLLSMTLVACTGQVQKQTPKLKGAEAGTVRKLGKDNTPMTFVPAGEFLRGSSPEQVGQALDLCERFAPGVCDEDWFIIETPQRSIFIDAFWMDRNEVSNAQYERCVNDGACPPIDRANCELWVAKDGEWRRLSTSTIRTSFGSPQQPVVCTTWADADTYCRWADKRLPSEAEWEKAARGDQGRTFPWGETLPECRRAHMDQPEEGGEGCGTRVTGYVGARAASGSPYGTLDMSGNVAEWTLDYADRTYYETSPQRNPINNIPSERRMLRGGGWNNHPTLLRAANRSAFPPDFRTVYNGFRCAMDPLP